MIKKNIIPLVLLFVIVIISSCSKEPEIDNNIMLDGNKIFDPSLYKPELYLVSKAIPNPSAIQLDMPVVIAAHGYSASTFEWDEFRAFGDSVEDILVSQVLLGGHGNTYEDFKKSSWEDWKIPILDEYIALKNKGYTNISFAGSSTGCPLALSLIKSGEIADNGLKKIFFIDPIVIPSDKLLTIVGLVGPMIGYVETELNDDEEGHWYHFRPQETLKELMKLLDVTRKDLQTGYKLPNGTKLKIYKSIKDPSADPASAVLIYKGLKNNDNTPIDVEMIESNLHVMTHLQGRDNVSQYDIDIQNQVFVDMYSFLKD